MKTRSLRLVELKRNLDSKHFCFFFQHTGSSSTLSQSTKIQVRRSSVYFFDAVKSVFKKMKLVHSWRGHPETFMK